MRRFYKPKDPKPKDPPGQSDQCCKTKHKGWHGCSNYKFSSFGKARDAVFGAQSKVRKKEAAKKCGAGGGTHYTMGDDSGFLGTVICCGCCEDTPKFEFCRFQGVN